MSYPIDTARMETRLLATVEETRSLKWKNRMMTFIPQKENDEIDENRMIPMSDIVLGPDTRGED